MGGGGGGRDITLYNLSINESTLKSFITKQDQQLILLGNYIETLFKHRISLSIDAK